ncbi:MAG: hypothetical protein ACREJG_05570 [Candidatus Rokuibacteriota bacterium]
MLTLGLDHDEHDLLLEVLVRHQNDLRVEINHTDSRQLRARLKRDAQRLEGLIERLGAARMAPRTVGA